MRLSDIRVDVGKVEGGVWWNYETQSTCKGNEPEDGALCLLILPAISGRLSVALAEEQMPHVEALRAPPPGEEATPSEVEDYRRNRDRITRRTRAAAMARTTLLDWRGLEDDDGQPVEFSRDRAREILGDVAYLPLADFVERAALSAEASREERAASKN